MLYAILCYHEEDVVCAWSKEQLGWINGRRPKMISVQAAGCAPIVRAWEAGKDAAAPWENPDTKVWGLRVPRAIGDFLVLRALYDTAGSAIAVDEARLAGITDWVAAHEGLRFGMRRAENGTLPRFELKAKRLVDERTVIGTEGERRTQA